MTRYETIEENGVITVYKIRFKWWFFPWATIVTIWSILPVPFPLGFIERVSSRAAHPAEIVSVKSTGYKRGSSDCE